VVYGLYPNATIRMVYRYGLSERVQLSRDKRGDMMAEVWTDLAPPPPTLTQGQS
jgi:hypothetical protein